jgi:NADH-quinone oxidoreductase subunit L
MQDFFADHPGRYFVLATLLPLAGAIILLLSGAINRLTRPTAKPSKLPGFFAVGVMLMASILSIHGSWLLYKDGIGNSATPKKMTIESSSLFGQNVYGFSWTHIVSENIDWLTLNPLASNRIVPSNAYYPAKSYIVLDDSNRHRTPPKAKFSLGYRIDSVTIVLFPMVCIITSLVMVFSISYMSDEATLNHEDHEYDVIRRGRFGQFFLYLLLFAFSMQFLLIGDNLVQVFMSWELVGICSYFLIGFYTERHRATQASLKAFLMNRIGDAGFLMAIFIAWNQFGTLSFTEWTMLQQVVPRDTNSNLLPLVADQQWLSILLGLGILSACIGKSAQWPLHTWLPDAMEGPTPVSALIHAATMVAAGVYLFARCFMIVTDVVMFIAVNIGALTMLLGAVIAMRQTDLKKILAYSTISQLGLMFFVLGCGSWVAGLFHLFTHAFFKALMFLASGSVIHAIHHEQDVCKMGGLRKSLPITAYAMLIGVLAISGVPFLSGWASKEYILGPSLSYWHYRDDPLKFTDIYVFVPILGSILTSYYMLRMWILVFLGSPRSDEAANSHESDSILLVPLILLSFLTLTAGISFHFWDAHESYIPNMLKESAVAGHTSYIRLNVFSNYWLVELSTLLIGLACFGLGFAFAIRQHLRGSLLPTGEARGLRKVIERKFYFDEAYDFLFTRPTLALARLSAKLDKQALPTDKPFDVTTVDGVMNLPADAAPVLSGKLGLLQSGNVRQYVFALVLTLLGVFGILMLR